MTPKTLLPLPDGYDIRHGSGTSTTTRYSVEAMYDYRTPVSIGDIVLDNRWQKLHPADGADDYGLLSYEEAQALRWVFLSSVNNVTLYCVKTRLVVFKATVTWEVTATGIVGD